MISRTCSLFAWCLFLLIGAALSWPVLTPEPQRTVASPVVPFRPVSSLSVPDRPVSSLAVTPEFRQVVRLRAIMRQGQLTTIRIDGHRDDLSPIAACVRIVKPKTDLAYKNA